MALSIFSNRSPDPPQGMTVFKCPATGCDAQLNEYSINCPSCGSNFQSCVATGRPVLTKDYYKCAICKHKTLMDSIRLLGIKHCVLCHNRLDPKRLAEKAGPEGAQQPGGQPTASAAIKQAQQRANEEF
jgi:hypothetical protein